MELKRYFFLTIFLLFSSHLNADLIKPDKQFTPYDVVKIQLEALKKNGKKNLGIRQTWLFAHPNNKKVTGPYERFEMMIYGQQYKLLLNHNSHKIILVMNSPKKYIYKIEVLSKEKQLIMYEWHIQKGSENKCEDCWFTSAVSQPVDQGNTI